MVKNIKISKTMLIVGIIGLLVVPFIFDILVKAKRPQSYVIVSALELIAGFCLRYVILIGGQI